MAINKASYGAFMQGNDISVTKEILNVRHETQRNDTQHKDTEKNKTLHYDTYITLYLRHGA
jgi:hypothetical protein